MRAPALLLLAAACSGGDSSPTPDAAPDACAETDLAACARLGKECGAFAAPDVCGAPRTLACGECTAPEFCGANDEANQCGRTEVRFVAASSLSTIDGTPTMTLAVPAGVQEGDLLLALIETNGAADVTLAPPAGWTEVRKTNGASQIQHFLHRRIATAAEPASYIWDPTQPSFRGAAIMLAYRGVDSVTPVEAEAALADSGTVLTIAGPQLTPPAGSDEPRLLVGFYGIQFPGLIMTTPLLGTPAGMTLRAHTSGPSDATIPYFALAGFDERVTIAGPVAGRVSAVTVTCANCNHGKTANAVLLAP